jgi:CHAT domain-containing protein
MARLDREIDTLGDSLATLEAKLRASDPTAAARLPGVLPPDSIRRALLGPGQAILGYFWGDRDVFAWWITADTAKAARLGPVEALQPTVDFLKGAIERRDDPHTWRGAAARAWRELVAPLAPTDAAEVLVIADGPIHRIPVESFIPADGALPWGAGRRFSYGPSASVQTTLARAPKPSWSRSLLAVGNPALLPGDRADDELRAAGLGPLPHAEDEARAIHRLFEEEGGADLLVGSRATLDRWRARDPARYRYLHFALHAVASDRRPDAGALLFGGGRLDLAAVRRLRLEAELATLSACETGVGRWVRGEGVIGLQHAFLSAGARSVVVTLWQVADRSTADFMGAFYGEVRAGRSPAEALARTKAEWIRSAGERAHPWRWAPFVLIGAPAGRS